MDDLFFLGDTMTKSGAHCFVATILQRKYKSATRLGLPSLRADILQRTALRTVLDNKRILGLTRPLIYKPSKAQ